MQWLGQVVWSTKHQEPVIYLGFQSGGEAGDLDPAGMFYFRADGTEEHIAKGDDQKLHSIFQSNGEDYYVGTSARLGGGDFLGCLDVDKIREQSRFDELTDALRRVNAIGVFMNREGKPQLKAAIKAEQAEQLLK